MGVWAGVKIHNVSPEYEYPPGMFKEGGAGASVRPIEPSDNARAGACIGNACRGLADGTKVRIVPNP
jgi:hypothetical protein